MPQQRKETSWCYMCKSEKPPSCFFRDRSRKSGLQTRCKDCSKIRDSSPAFRRKRLVWERKAQEANRQHRRDYMKRYRELYPEKANKSIVEYRKRNPLKFKAHLMVREAVKLGTLVKQPCEECGEIKVDAHHPDYTKPLEVMWLCRKYHKLIHRIKL